MLIFCTRKANVSIFSLIVLKIKSLQFILEYVIVNNRRNCLQSIINNDNIMGTDVCCVVVVEIPVDIH